MDRTANEAIADMSGAEAPPRRNGELVFHDEWERRAFAMAVALCEQGHYGWDEFRQRLVAAIAAVGEAPEHPNPEAPGYFEHWLASFENVLADKNILSTGALSSQGPTHQGEDS